MGCCSNQDCPGSYCMNSPDKKPPFSCHGKDASEDQRVVATPKQCKTNKDCPDTKCGAYCMNDASKKPPYFCHARDPKMGCCSNQDCPGSYCMNSPDKTPPFSCHGGKKNAAMIKAPVDEYCLHKEDQLDHKCYEDCAA